MEVVNRKNLLLKLVVIAVLAPILSISMEIGDNSIFIIVYGILLPSCPFILLSILAIVKNKKGEYKFNKGAIGASMLGAILSVGIPNLLMWLSSITYSGGGANIGLGLLFLAMPIYLLIAMVTGWSMGLKNMSSNKIN